MILPARGTLLPACALLVGALLVLVPGLPARPAQKPQEPKPPEQATTFRVDVDVVNVLVTVKDRKGKLINTLDKNDFEVAEDGQRQQIRYFSRETALPLTVGLLIDTSVSQWRLVPAEKEAGEIFFRRVLGAKDLAFLISFDTDVDLLQDFTASQALLRNGLERLRVNAPGAAVSIPSTQGPFPGLRRGGTRLYDAVYLAARDKLATEVGRKTVVLITDGEEQGSKVKLDEAVEAAQKADVIIYGILFYDYRFYRERGMGYSGESSLKKMAEETGGRVVVVDRGKDLPAAFEEISQELRSQYSLGYVSSNPGRDNRFRRLRIRTMRDDLRVQARKGYYRVQGEE